LRQIYIGGSHLWFLAFIFIYCLVAKPLNSIDPFVVAGGLSPLLSFHLMVKNTLIGCYS